MFITRLEQFWEIYYTHNEGSLISFEEFLKDPLTTLIDLQENYDLKANNNYKSELTIKLDINYKKKFKNIEEIKDWFEKCRIFV